MFFIQIDKVELERNLHILVSMRIIGKIVFKMENIVLFSNVQPTIAQVLYFSYKTHRNSFSTKEANFKRQCKVIKKLDIQ